MGATISEHRELMRQRSVTLTPDLVVALDERALRWGNDERADPPQARARHL